MKRIMNQSILPTWFAICMVVKLNVAKIKAKKIVKEYFWVIGLGFVFKGLSELAQKINQLPQSSLV